MQTIPENIELLLPYGEALRSFMEQPFITPADLRHALRARGVFLSKNEKRDTMPVLACCLLSPREFDDLRERQATREDNPKTITQTLAWNSTKSVLESLPADFNLSELIPCDSANYKLIGTPAFVPVGNDPNIVCCEFEIEREDLSKNWAAIKSNFKGKLRIEKMSPDGPIQITLTNTADETKELNRKFAQRLTAHFKDNGDVKRESEVETILFSSFDNENRITFFRSLTRGIDALGFHFTGATDFGVSPDSKHPLPEHLKWMEDHVKGLKIKGVALQNTFFMKDKDKESHKFFLFYSMEAKFDFDNFLAQGSCSIVFEFPEFAAKEAPDAEFEVNISGLTLAKGFSHVNRVQVKEELLKRINAHKLVQFEKWRLKPATAESITNNGSIAGREQLELSSVNA